MGGKWKVKSSVFFHIFSCSPFLTPQDLLWALFMVLFYFLFLNYCWCIYNIGLKCTTAWLDIYMTYKVINPVILVPIWHHIVITILVNIIPMLYCTSPWLFCNYHFIVLNLFVFFTHSLNLPLIWQPSKGSLYLCLSMSCSACLFILFLYSIYT